MTKCPSFDLTQRSMRLPCWTAKPDRLLMSARQLTAAGVGSATVDDILALVVMTVAYLVIVELTKKVFSSEPVRLSGQPDHTRGEEHRIHRRAARFNHAG